MVRVEVRDGAGNAVNNKFVRLLFQETDASGNPAAGDTVSDGYTDNTGMISFHVTPGTYALRIGDNYYYNIAVRSGEITTASGTP